MRHESLECERCVPDPQAESGVRTAAHRRPLCDLLIVLWAEAFGGSERHTVDLVNYLLAAGWRLTLVLPHLDLVPLGIRDDPQGRLEVVREQLPVRGLRPADVRVWRQLFRRHPARRALLVKPWYYAADLRMLRALRASYAEVIHLEHSLVPPLAAYRVRRHWAVVPGLGLWWFRDRWRRWAMSRTADRFLAVSEAGRRSMLADAGVLAERVVTCPNGVDLQQWQRDPAAGHALRRRLGIDDNVRLFGSVGHLVPIKGLDLALQAFARLRSQTARPVAYCLAGEGPCRQDLERLAIRLDVAGAVHFLGHQRQVQPLYSALDTLLCPSRVESFSLCCLEAMACQCRVIAAAVGGLSEVIADPVCGRLLDSRDPDLWARAMAEFAELPEDKRRALGQQARAHVACHHDQRQRFAWLESVLRQPLGRVSEEG
jgi:glycosyltransferase involved in cell wall biosynthesis